MWGGLSGLHQISGLTSGDLTIFNGDLNTNTINNSSTNLAINSTNNVEINSNQINIGTNQPSLIFNTINIGSVLSGSQINLNGIVNSTFTFNIGQVSQW
jgi:hypothetical protein